MGDGGGKGCLIIGAAGGVFAFILGLLLLFTMVGGGVSTGSGTGGLLNTSKVPAKYVQWVDEAGAKCGQVSAPLIAAQIEQESGWNPNAESSTGAEGIAQFEPGTWPTWGYAADGVQPPSPWDAADGIVTMAIYDCALAKDVAKVPGDATSNMLAAYNAGPAAVIQYGGIPPFAQTQQYVQSIETMIPTYTAALPTSSPGSFAAAEIADAEHWLGTPYVYGGGNYFGPTGGLGSSTGIQGFDCSGLVMYAAYQASHGTIQLPHSSEIDATLGQAVPLSQVQPGDIIAIQTGGPGDYSHVVIYVGGGEIVEAPTTGENVKLAPLSDFNGMTMTARRIG